MMFKRQFSMCLVIIVVFSLIDFQVFAQVKPAINTKVNKRALILYEIEKEFSYNENIVNHLNELLYVFNENVDKVSINEYTETYIDDYDSIFVINIKNNISNNVILEDLLKYKHKIYWIGDKIEDFLEYSPKYSMTFKAQNNNINNLKYKSNSILIEPGKIFNILDYKDDTNVISTMSDGYNIYPFILNDKNLFYISRWDLEYSFIFEDSLNDFYRIDNFEMGKVFIRIEDVHPLRDTNSLKEIADYLYLENIPFMIALIPTYVDSKYKIINTLDLKPDFIEAIKYMQDKGGTVILHGYAHQIGNDEVSGEGFEFWDVLNNKPIKDDIQVYIKNRVLSGLRLCIENGIYPLAFEAPHYAMNIDGYKEIKKYFSTYVGQYQNNNEIFTTSTFPYIIRNSDAFNILIPENLGYIGENDDFAVEKIEENFKKLQIVRGYAGGFFFHPYLDINYLKETVAYLKENDIAFIDLKNEENYVRIDDINITSSNGSIYCTYDKTKAISNVKETSKFDKFIHEANNIIIIFIVIILIVFFIIFIIFSRINKNKFIRR